MRDMDRAEVTRYAYRRLADADFRRRLTGTAADGSHPILAGLPEDPLREVLTSVSKVGGGANVVMPLLNGIVVMAIGLVPGARATNDATAPRLADDCTLGLFAARLMSDPASTIYRFISTGQNRDEPAPARAELVALGG